MRVSLRTVSFLVLGVFFFSNIITWGAVWDLNNPQVLEVNFLDVGQGDATLIKTPQNHQILIDGGPDSSILEKLGKEMPFWDRSIDLIILTHPHQDHLAGFIDVLKNYRVENILWTGVSANTAVFEQWERAIMAEEAKIYIAELRQKITAGQVILEVIHPFESLEKEKFKDQADEEFGNTLIDKTSLVLLVSFKENTFLFTGDAPKSVEKELMERPINLKADVLKVGHHGSRTSTADEFLQKVLPDFTVISSGKKNRYGHPHQETLDTLKNYDISVLRTDQQGDVEIISNGKNLRIHN
ncbi:MAG: ComEC/Rec2 family competence protein [Patescibacteria group bacterium]